MINEDTRSLHSFYGMIDLARASRKCIEYDDYADIEKNVLQIKLLNTSEKVMVLLVAIYVDSTYERKLPFSRVLKKKFGLGLCCDTILDQQYQRRSQLVRVGAFRVFDNQMPEIIKALYRLSLCAFLVCVEERSVMDLTKHLIQLFQGGSLAPNVLAACCNTALGYKASFVHVLRGCDGCSINLFSPLLDENVIAKEE